MKNKIIASFATVSLAICVVFGCGKAAYHYIVPATTTEETELVTEAKNNTDGSDSQKEKKDKKNDSDSKKKKKDKKDDSDSKKKKKNKKQKSTDDENKTEQLTSKNN